MLSRDSSPWSTRTRTTRRERGQRSVSLRHDDRTSSHRTLPTREDRPCPAMRLLPTSRVSWTVRVRRKRRRSSAASCWRTPGSPMPSCTSRSGERTPPQRSRPCHHRCVATWMGFFAALERCAGEAEEAFRGRVEAILMVPAPAAEDEDAAPSVPAEDARPDVAGAQPGATPASRTHVPQRNDCDQRGIVFG